MQIQLIRNATMKITLAGMTILTDPVFSPKHGIESFAGIEKNPTVDLPFPVEEVLKGVDFVLVSHLHQDHFDKAAQEMLPKEIPIYCRPEDEEKIKGFGFMQVRSVNDSVDIHGLSLSLTPGSHAGNRKWQDILGTVCGFVLFAENEPTVYWAGDTILTDEVKDTIRDIQPDIIITHSCGAVLDDSGPIVMDAQQTIDVCKLAAGASVVAVHLEALDHGTVTRADIRELAEKNSISHSRLIIPKDGETLIF
jgi:L-ascorbate metabolism protein UlaG (beta-lactamase superfamily)